MTLWITLHTALQHKHFRIDHKNSSIKGLSMNAHQFFEIASFAPLDNALSIPLQREQDNLLVTGLYLGNLDSARKATKELVYVQPLLSDDEANETLNKITQWMSVNNALDQRGFHNERRFDYNITFLLLPAGDEQHLSVVENFYLEDYLFDHCHREQASHLDDLMRMLDRDKMAGAMLKSLNEDFGMWKRDDAPLFWRRDIRQCSHPDHKVSWGGAPKLVVA